MPGPGTILASVLGAFLALNAGGCASIPFARTASPRGEDGETALSASLPAVTLGLPIPRDSVLSSQFARKTTAPEVKASGALEAGLHHIRDDFQHFYAAENLTLLTLDVGLAAPLANTHADQGVRDWYQHHVRSSTTDQFADAARLGGEFLLIAPLTFGASLSGLVFEDTPTVAVVSTWGDRSFRALMVGAPALATLQLGLGASRPSEGDSHWHPFQDSHGASGHSFIGAVPWLTAAGMTDSLALRSVFVAGSLLPAWSRINDDKHYLSQVVLGYGLAFLAVESVRQTETGERWFRIFPMLAGCPGFGFLLRY